MPNEDNASRACSLPPSFQVRIACGIEVMRVFSWCQRGLRARVEGARCELRLRHGSPMLWCHALILRS